MPSPSVLHVRMAMKAAHGIILANYQVPFYELAPDLCRY